MIPLAIFETTIRTFLAPIVPFLDDASVTEIMINGPNEIFIERRGLLERTEASFASVEALTGALRVIAQFAGRRCDEASPILEARLPDGSRVEAVLPPLAPEGPTLAIRRFSKERLTLARLLGFGALTEDSVQLLSALIECKQNIVVAGGTGSGKTSMLNALSALVPAGERLVVLEDARELQLQREHVVQLETRAPDARGRGAITMRDLFKATLRLRPDRIVLGEIRGGEALDLVQAMTSGHGGCLTTVHATYPRDTLNRLETLALMGGVELPQEALRAQLGSAVDIVVQTSRMRDGSRRVTHITEVLGSDPRAGYLLRDLFVLTPGATPKSPQIFGPTGELPDCLELIHSHGLRLPPCMYEAAQRKVHVA